MKEQQRVHCFGERFLPKTLTQGCVCDVMECAGSSPSVAAAFSGAPQTAQEPLARDSRDHRKH